MAAHVLFDPVVGRLIALIQAAATTLGTIRCWTTDCERGDHVHAMPTLALCLAGVLRIEGEGRIDLHAGEGVVIGTGVRHRVFALRPGAVSLDLGLLAGWCDFQISGEGRDLWCRVRGSPIDRLLSAAAESSQADERQRLVSQLLAALGGERIESMLFPHPGLVRMAATMWSNRSNLDAAAVLAASGLRRRQAHQLFTDFFGTTPRCALEDQRLAIAAAHLAAGLPVAEAARRAGYGRRAALTRAWRRRHGGSPREVRGD